MRECAATGRPVRVRGAAGWHAGAEVQGVGQHTCTILLDREPTDDVAFGGGQVVVELPREGIPGWFSARVWRWKGPELEIVLPAAVESRDRRAGPRAPLDAPETCLLALDDRVLRRRIVDIGAGGFLVELRPRDALQPGGRLDQVRLPLPGGEPIVAAATVAWTSMETGELGLAGLALVEVAPAHHARLAAWSRVAATRRRLPPPPPPPGGGGAYALVHTAKGGVRRRALLNVAYGAAEMALEADDASLMRTGNVSMVELVVAEERVPVVVRKLVGAVLHEGQPVRARASLWSLPDRIRAWLTSMSRPGRVPRRGSA